MLDGTTNNIVLIINGNNSIYSAWSHETWGMNTNIPKKIKMGESVNFSLVLDLSKTGEETNVENESYTGYKLSLYENGILVESSYLNTKQWEQFKEKCKSSSADSFFLGIDRNGNVDKGKSNDYGKMILKNCRLYTRPLTTEEIELNYDTRLAYDEANN